MKLEKMEEAKGVLKELREAVAHYYNLGPVEASPLERQLTRAGLTEDNMLDLMEVLDEYLETGEVIEPE